VSSLLSLSVLYMMISYVRSELSDVDCLSLGFVKNNLQCSTCISLNEYGLEVLKPDCLSCCSGDVNEAESNATAKKYAKARLEVCG